MSQERAMGPAQEIKVAEPNEIADGGSKIIHVQGRNIALFRVKDQYFAISNNCLTEGDPSGRRGQKLRGHLPWHGWNTTSGRQLQLDTYVKGEDLSCEGGT